MRAWWCAVLFAVVAVSCPQVFAQSAPQSRIKAQAFDLEAVRLLDGPFKSATARDAEYLLRLEPDRLLAWFRKEAGLEPKGEVYGGWESRGVAGHSLGHYLSACAMMYASTGDTRLRDRVTYVVDELAACQKANGNGYVAAIPNGKEIFKQVAAGDIRSQGFDLNGGWVPWYTMHKVFAGLLDANRYCASDRALTVATGLADWAVVTLANLDDAQFQRMLACEHGGMNESLAELYTRTGNEKYLALSRRFHHRAVLDPLSRGEDRLDGLHANTQIPKLIGLARRYELTGDESDKRTAEFFWDRVVHHHSYVIGGNSDGEHFGPPDKLNRRLSQNSCEVCNTYNMLKLTRHLFAWHPTGELADFYERALYNHILASQNPTSGMVCYYVPLGPGSEKAYSTPFDSFWCCVGSGMENHAKYGDSIYFHDDAGLWVNLFVASEVRWKERGLTLRQETTFPEAGTTTLSVTAEKPVDLALRIRRPAWAGDGFAIEVNGRAQRLTAADGYAVVSRTWKTGDRVEVKLPMALRLETMPDEPKRVAVMYGPLVMAGDLGATATIKPALVTGGKPLADWIKPVPGQPATFRTTSAGRPGDVTLRPFYRTHDVKYSVYWDLFTPAEWSRREADYRAEEERVRKLEAATVDLVQPGEMQPERDHEMRGERTEAGDGPGKKWRHAVDGGWFSFDMKVPSDAPVSLVCTFWGSDAGDRTFDILVDGVRVGTKTLAREHPEEFFDQTYAIPPEVTRGKSQVTVRFQAHPGKIAGGVFGLRIIK